MCSTACVLSQHVVRSNTRRQMGSSQGSQSPTRSYQPRATKVATQSSSLRLGVLPRNEAWLILNPAFRQLRGDDFQQPAQMSPDFFSFRCRFCQRFGIGVLHGSPCHVMQQNEPPQLLVAEAHGRNRCCAERRGYTASVSVSGRPTDSPFSGSNR